MGPHRGARGIAPALHRSRGCEGGDRRRGRQARAALAGGLVDDGARLRLPLDCRSDGAGDGGTVAQRQSRVDTLAQYPFRRDQRHLRGGSQAVTAGERPTMAPPFAQILEAARTRFGATALEARLPQPRSTAELKAVPDDRYLSQMSLRIFRAGLKHSLVDAKWPVFEEVFHGFELRRVRAMSDEALEGLLGNARLIRHWGKLKSVRDNAAAMLEVAGEHGSFGAWLAGWPGSDIVGLWEALAKRFSQMGGNSGPSLLRMVGKDTFILTPSVTSALKHWGAISAPPKNRADRAAVQAAFNGWAKESGRRLC